MKKKTYRAYYHHEGEAGPESIHCQEFTGREAAEDWIDTALLCGCDIFQLEVE